jgi:hypothetical protein
MSEIEHLKGVIVDYLSSLKSLVSNPKDFFGEMGPVPDYKVGLTFALPPVLVYAIAESVQKENPYLFPLYCLAAYGEIAFWMVALKYVLIPFGERRSFKETLQIAAPVSFVFSIAWIPYVGAPLAVVAAGLWTVLGLTYGFKMNSGAALTAVTLPVVVAGVLGALLSFVFIFLASLSRVFSGP